MSPAKGQTSPYCKRGHHKPTVGTQGNGWCSECARQSYERRGKKLGEAPDVTAVNFRDPYCPAGHDKRVVGVGMHYECKECRRIRSEETDWKAYRSKRSNRLAGLPENSAVERFTSLPNLKELRLRTGRTQREMATLIGVSHKHYESVESGDKRVTRKTLVRAMEGISRKDVPAGKYRKVLEALAEAERAGEPTASRAAAIMDIHPIKIGPSLRWLAHMGLAERFESDGRVYWLACIERAA